MFHNSKKNFKYLDIFIGILFTFFLISFGLFVAIHFRPLYYFDIDYLNIVEQSGLSKEVILENYNTLIDYCSPFFKGELIFPSLAQSPSGTSHFVEVKNIFNFFFYLGIICFTILIPIIIYKYKKKDVSYLFISSLTTIILPTLVGICCAINFDKTFVLFHKIVFQNDDWLFDPQLDQVITILPETFFLHSALIIIAVVLIGSLLLLTYFLHTKKINSLK